jgi:endonuclease YncB( thermonuclease family)
MGRRRVAWQCFGIALLVLPAGFPAASEPIHSIPDCRGAAVVTIVEAAGARDGATILLKDGGEVRLANIIAPAEPDGSAESARAAAAALNDLVAGRKLILHAGKNERDRYGRIVAQAALHDDPAKWVQAALVGAGHARVQPGSGGPDCSAGLMASNGRPESRNWASGTRRHSPFCRPARFPRPLLRKAALRWSKRPCIGWASPEGGFFSTLAGDTGKISRS